MARRRARRHYSRRSYRRSRRGTTSTKGIFPVLLGGLAAATPFFASAGGRNAPITDLMNLTQPGADITGSAGSFVADTTASLVDNAPTIAALVAGAIATSWAAKKFGVRRATKIGRKWSLF